MNWINTIRSGVESSRAESSVGIEGIAEYNASIRLSGFYSLFYLWFYLWLGRVYATASSSLELRAWLAEADVKSSVSQFGNTYAGEHFCTDTALLALISFWTSPQFLFLFYKLLLLLIHKTVIPRVENCLVIGGLLLKSSHEQNYCDNVCDVKFWP